MNVNLNKIKAVLFDLDGTVYYGSKIIDGANETIEFFRKNGKRIFFTTNNSTKTRKQIYEKLVGMGVRLNAEEVLNSGYLAAAYCKKQNLQKIYLFGSQNLKDEFEEMGVTTTDEEQAENLLIGYNVDMDYDYLTSAVNVALKAKQIIACNRERVFPGDNARLMPGCGAMTAPIEWCANRQCDLIIGKPNTFLADYIVDEYGIDYGELLVIGDTYESDVEMAKRAGANAILISNKKYDDCICVNKIKEIGELWT